MERIVASSAFAKSDRLCSFLLHICELGLQGRVDEINETNIGARLFCRPDYDPTIDGIVRSHASRMRQRLERYFSEEGAEEPIRLFIPKGAYIPVFEARSSEAHKPQPVPHESASAEVDTAKMLATAVLAAFSNRLALWVLGPALALACITISYLLARQYRDSPRPLATATTHPLWAPFFGSNYPTTIVCADTSLAILQDLTERITRQASCISRIQTTASTSRRPPGQRQR